MYVGDLPRLLNTFLREERVHSSQDKVLFWQSQKTTGGRELSRNNIFYQIVDAYTERPGYFVESIERCGVVWVPINFADGWQRDIRNPRQFIHADPLSYRNLPYS
jgi:hypothetical protein